MKAKTQTGQPVWGATVPLRTWPLLRFLFPFSFEILFNFKLIMWRSWEAYYWMPKGKLRILIRARKCITKEKKKQSDWNIWKLPKVSLTNCPSCLQLRWLWKKSIWSMTLSHSSVQLEERWDSALDFLFTIWLVRFFHGY